MDDQPVSQETSIATASSDRALRRLVRAVAGHAASGRTVAFCLGDAAGDRLTASDGSSMAVDRAIVADAVRRGLLTRSGARIEPSAEARAFLRRALADPADTDPQAGFNGQHGTIVEVSGAEGSEGGKLRLNRSESPLAAMARLKDKSGQPFLPEEAIAAGERLHADFTRAGLQPRLTMSYEPRVASRTKGAMTVGASLSDSTEAARQRVAKAVTAIGPELSGVALDVCCFEKGLETVERERQWPARSAKLLLRAALMALARHYHSPGPAGPGGPRAWGAEGYRPKGRDFGAAAS